MIKRIAVLCLAFLLVVSLVSCSTGSSEQPSSNEAVNDEYQEKDREEIQNALNIKLLNEDLAKQKLIKDVSMSIETVTYDPLLTQLIKEIQAVGGYVQVSEVDGKGHTYANDRKARIVAYIPYDKLNTFTGQVSSIGNVTYNRETVQEVTTTLADVESRIKALRIEQDSLLSILKKADNLEDIQSIQDRLANVCAKLEIYETKLRNYEDTIFYCTVTLSIREVKSLTPTEQNIWQVIGNNLMGNLNNIGEGILWVFVLVTSSLPYIALVVLFVLFVIFGIRFSLKKIRRKNKVIQTPPTNTPES